MRLIKKSETKIDKKGYRRSFGLFLCSYCLQEVEKELSHGKRYKSCGCMRKILIIKGNKGKNVSKETRQKISNYHKGKKHTEKTKQKQSISNSGENNPMYGIHRFGELNPNWNGGSSFDPYPIEFNKQKKLFILKRDNYKCQNLECSILNIKKLMIHHIDYNKQNINDNNLITLCNSCHSKTNGKKNRDYWKNYYQNIIKGGDMYALDISRCFSFFQKSKYSS